MRGLRDYIIKNDILFNIFLDEPNNQFLYRDERLTEELGTVEPFNHKVYKVLSTRMINDRLFGFIKGKREIGWVNLESSYYVYNKTNDIVFLKEGANIQNELNIKYNFTKSFTEDIQKKYLTSKGLINYNDEFYELLYKKERFIGFMKSSDLDVGYNVEYEITLPRDKELFVDSQFKTKVNNENDTYKLIMIFPNKSIGKVECENKKFWIDLKYVDDVELNKILSTLETYNPTENAEINDLINNFLNERKKSKNLLISLVKDKINNGVEGYTESVDNPSRVNERYQNLKNSKLGKLQIKYWNMRKKWGK